MVDTVTRYPSQGIFFGPGLNQPVQDQDFMGDLENANSSRQSCLPELVDFFGVLDNDTSQHAGFALEGHLSCLAERGSSKRYAATRHVGWHR